MNINVILGTISFVVWSIFSTWFYLNFVKNLESDTMVASVMEVEPPAPPIKEEIVVEDAAVSSEIEEEAPVEVEAPKPLSISENFTFELNSDEVIDKQALEAFIDEVKEAANGREIRIEITGHTCDLGSNAYNTKLGMKRANKVKNALSTSGFDQIDVQSQGESNPMYPNDSDENRSKNRRVAISITTVS